MKKVNIAKPRVLLMIFEILALILLFTYNLEEMNKDIILLGLGLVFLVYISNLVLCRLSSGDHYIFLICTMLMSIGLIMIYRLKPDLGIKQLIFVGIGVLAFYITYLILKYIMIWDRFIILYILLGYFLFTITFLFSSRTHGAKNWISLFNIISFQPAEITKLVLIFILASHYGNEKSKRILYNTKYEKYSSLLILVIAYSYIGLLFLQRDLGMSLIFYGIFLIIQFIFEEDRRLVYGNIILFIISGLMGYIIFNHVRIRFDIWIDPWKYADTVGYQIIQGLFSIAEGGFFGKGLGLGNPQFIPLAYNDFIYPAIIEEMGIFMGIAIIMLFMILVYRGFKIAIRQKQPFLKVLAFGVSALFGVQSFIILGGVLNVIPLTGITLPFMAYGGTSILSSFIALGVLQVASEDIEWGDSKWIK